MDETWSHMACSLSTGMCRCMSADRGMHWDKVHSTREHMFPSDEKKSWHRSSVSDSKINGFNRWSVVLGSKEYITDIVSLDTMQKHIYLWPVSYKHTVIRISINHISVNKNFVWMPRFPAVNSKYLKRVWRSIFVLNEYHDVMLYIPRQDASKKTLLD